MDPWVLRMRITRILIERRTELIPQPGALPGSLSVRAVADGCSVIKMHTCSPRSRKKALARSDVCARTRAAALMGLVSPGCRRGVLLSDGHAIRVGRTGGMHAQRLRRFESHAGAAGAMGGVLSSNLRAKNARYASGILRNRLGRAHNA